MPQRASNKVKVYVRTRPTNHFASEVLAIGRDNKVSSHVLIHYRRDLNKIIDFV